jgi:hypothetical protein
MFSSLNWHLNIFVTGSKIQIITNIARAADGMQEGRRGLSIRHGRSRDTDNSHTAGDMVSNTYYTMMPHAGMRAASQPGEQYMWMATQPARVLQRRNIGRCLRVRGGIISCLLHKNFTIFFKIPVTSNLTAHTWSIKYR